MKTLLSILAILLLTLYVIPNSMAWDWEEELMADGSATTTITDHGAIGGGSGSDVVFSTFTSTISGNHTCNAIVWNNEWAEYWHSVENPNYNQPYIHFETMEVDLYDHTAEFRVDDGETEGTSVFYMKYPY